ncbi:MAG: DUF6491 family protein [Sphingomonadales bacterium]
MRAAFTAALVGGLLVAAPAAAEQTGKDCFWLSEISGFSKADRKHVHVHTGPSEVYVFETMGTCSNLNFTEDIAFEKDTPGQICSGLDVDLIVPTAIGPQRCPVKMISKLPAR